MAQRDISFAIALPPGWDSIDLLQADQPLIEGSVAEVLAGAARDGEHAQLLMLRALVATAPDSEPLAAGLSVTVADSPTPVASEPLDPDTFAGCEVSAVTLPVGGGLRVRQIAPAPVPKGAEPLDVLRLQYLTDAPQGLLSVTFATVQAPRAGQWEQLFDAMAATSRLD
ncbi:MAG: hypothetical protein M3Z27_02445 [Actinomycetota bacterium]|nr:hypothetical protein [Actinomycetota bacterium]